MYQSRHPNRGVPVFGGQDFAGFHSLLLASAVVTTIAGGAFAEPFDAPDRSVSVLAQDSLSEPVAADPGPPGVTIDDEQSAVEQLPAAGFFAEACDPQTYDVRQWHLGDCLSQLRCKKQACWIGRADALIGWRDAPPDRPLLDTADTTLPVLNANQLDSTPAAGPRVAIIRENPCTGNAWETTYMRLANFRSQRAITAPDQQFALAPPGIYGNTNLQPFDTGSVNLGSMLQGIEVNHYRRVSQNIRLLAGFRWVEWQEQFTLSDNVASDPPISDIYQTKCVNDLYGGQIGADARILSFSWLRVDSVVKAGAYYNNAVQNSLYTLDDGAGPTTASIAVGQSPASCGFVGEVGITGAIPITHCLDLRIGYMGLWLSGIAQPTQQLSGQTLILPQPDPPIADAGSIVTNGGVLVQAVSIGLEGRW